MNKRVLLVENHPQTNIGLVGQALAEAQVATEMIRPWQGDAVPTATGNFDGLVVFGGAQDALDDQNHPYLPDLARLMALYGAADLPVLGICLGSQILARAHGGENLLGKTPEFGWCGIELCDDGRLDPVLSSAGDQFSIFQWHSDTFTLPKCAVRLARSARVENQCFRIGRASYGMQFHFEAGDAVVAEWVAHESGEIERFAPGWLKHYPAERERHLKTAEETGLAMARAWIALL